MGMSMATIVTVSKVFAAIGTAAKVAAVAATAKMVLDPPKTDLPDFSNMTDLLNANVKATKYQYAPTQDINIGFQNYLDNLEKVAPYYVSRYSPNLKRDYVNTINLREKQAAKDQPSIHSYRLPKAKIQLAQTQRRNDEKEEQLSEQSEE
jgi:hypothetical protein